MAIRPRQLRLRNSTTVALGAALLLISGLAFAGGGTFTGPTPYLSRADSPFAAELNAGHVYLEDFECGSILVPGVTASSGSVIPPGFEGLIDSVDADDGVIDGSGLNGHSFFTSNSVTFTFDQTTLGAFPTVAGIVWTDGDTPVTFEAFDSVGASLGTIGPVLLQDGSNAGGTAEDRFFGVTFAGGISKITISNAGGLEVDHLQYGLYRSVRGHAGRSDAVVSDAGASRSGARGSRPLPDPEDVAGRRVLCYPGVKRTGRAPSCRARPGRFRACRPRCGSSRRISRPWPPRPGTTGP